MLPWRVGEILFHRNTIFLRNLLKSNEWDTRTDSSQEHGRLNALRVLSVAVGGLSLAAAITAIAWFLRIRRNFRHNLIIILILSDMLKTLWLVILPSIELAKGITVGHNSTICQVSGFFLSVGIEACDLAVLLIAVHTALYILQGSQGLYPYRRAAYFAVAGIPLVLAALAFINAPAFTTFGPYCYLPLEPSWSSLALSWIPRYVVFTTILILYTFIYFYVRFLMDKFGNDTKRSRPQAAGRRQQTATVPPTPPLAYHGLLPSLPPSEAMLRSSGVADIDCTKNTKDESKAEFSIASSLQRIRADTSPPIITLSVPSSTLGELDSGRAEINDTDIRKPLEDNPSEYDNCVAVDRSSSQTQPSTGREQQEAMHLAVTTNLDSLLPPPLGSHAAPLSPSCQTTSPCIIISPSTLHETGMPKRRDKIRRQLGQLFVYPIVYMLGWLIPFVAHVSKADKSGQPFGLIVTSLASLCSQGLADSLVFLLMEKPWRHVQADADTGVCLVKRCLATNTPAVGRTKEELSADRRIARERRATELQERKLAHTDVGKKPREWWDVALADIDQCDRVDEEMELGEAASMPNNCVG